MTATAPLPAPPSPGAAGTTARGATEVGRLLLPLAAIAVFGLVVRMFFIARSAVVIESEATDYVRVAQNLVAGHGWVGIRGEGFALWVPPLFPVLVAAVSLVVSDAVLAARIVSAVLGASMSVSLGLMATWIYGRGPGLCAAALAAAHPFLIYASGMAQSDMCYLGLASWGLAFAVLSQVRGGTRPALLAGAAFGLAFLTRPEVLLVTTLCAAALLLQDRRPAGSGAVSLAASLLRAARRPLVLLGAFAVLTVPYVAWLSSRTGTLRVEGKSAMNYLTGQRMKAGMPLEQAWYEVTPDLVETGVAYQPNAALIRSLKVDKGEALSFAVTAARQNLLHAGAAIVKGRHLGSPVLFALVLLALLVPPWPPGRRKLELFLALVVGCALLPLLTFLFWFERYLLPLAPVLLVWAARGLVQLRDSVASRLTRWRPDRGWARWVAIAPALLAGLALVGIPTTAEWSYEMIQNRPNRRIVKDVGLELGRLAPGDKTVVDIGAQLTFYSGGTMLPLPYAEEPVALRYLAAKKPDFVVTDSAASARHPLRRWGEHGLDDPHAKLLLEKTDTRGRHIRVYRWQNP